MLIELQNLYLEHIQPNQLKDCLDLIKECQYYAFILHNKDVNKLTGEIKKPHYHCLVDLYIDKDSDLFNSNDSRRRKLILEYLQDLISKDINYRAVRNEKAFTRYLVHKDNQEKYQYNTSEIITNDTSRLGDNLEMSTTIVKNGSNSVLSILYNKIDNKEVINLMEIRKLSAEYQCLPWFLRDKNRIISEIVDYGYFKNPNNPMEYVLEYISPQLVNADADKDLKEVKERLENDNEYKNM